MKLSNLMGVLALASAIAACDSWTDQPPVEGIVRPPVGGTGGTGGTGGFGEGACTNEADKAVYATLTYTNASGVTFTGTEASAEIGADCIFGSADSTPALVPGCGTEAGEVISCFPNCSSATIQTLADCVASCTQTATGLSTECMACTGGTVACGAANCTNVCATDPNSEECVKCRCDYNCTPAFVICSGIPSNDCS